MMVVFVKYSYNANATFNNLDSRQYNFLRTVFKILIIQILCSTQEKVVSIDHLLLLHTVNVHANNY